MTRLKQAGLMWWQALKQSIEELGFTSLASDVGVFYYRGEGSFVVAIFYILTYNRASGQGISACTDSDWASNPLNCWSQSSYFVKMAKGLISWMLWVQKTVALSNTEAEYIALSDYSHQVVQMHTLLGELATTLRLSLSVVTTKAQFLSPLTQSPKRDWNTSISGTTIFTKS